MISTALALLKTDEQRNVLSEFYQKYKNRFYAIAILNCTARQPQKTQYRKLF